MTLPPSRLGVGNQPAEVPRRPDMARRPGLRQQPLGRDPTRRRPDLLRDQIGDLVIVPGPNDPLGRHVAGRMLLDDPLHRLVGDAADRGRTPIAAYVSIGGNHVHSFPRVLQWSPLRG